MWFGAPLTSVDFFIGFTISLFFVSTWIYSQIKYYLVLRKHIKLNMLRFVCYKYSKRALLILEWKEL